MGSLSEARYANCQKVIVVCDNLSKHTVCAFCERVRTHASPSNVSRLEFHDAPRHGSWLNIAANELSWLTRQCISGRRIGSEIELCPETTAWTEATNLKQTGVEWHLKINDARIKLWSVCPGIHQSQRDSQRITLAGGRCG